MFFLSNWALERKNYPWKWWFSRVVFCFEGSIPRENNKKVSCMSLKTVKVQIGFELYLFLGFYCLSKTLLKFSLRHISETNWHKQKQIQTHVWTLTVQFHLWQIMFELKSFFSLCLLQIHFGCFFWVPTWNLFWELFFFWTNPFWIVFSDLQFGRFLGANWQTSILDFVFDSKPILDLF